jgi:hypothetical protein
MTIPAADDRRRPLDSGECLDKLMLSIRILHDKMDGFNDVRAAQNILRQEFAAHLSAEAALIAKAFPDGDPDGHRRAHEAQIRESEERAEFWSRMRIKAGEMTVYAFLVCVVAVLGFYWSGHVPSIAALPGVAK